MNGTERVRAVITGKSYDRQPIYGWVWGNLEQEINEYWGSVPAFEDKYEFDIAHLFGGPYCFDEAVINTAAPIRTDELTPDLLVDMPIFGNPNNIADYEGFRTSLIHHKKRDRFCYAQTPGFFENFNGIFGIVSGVIGQDRLFSFAYTVCRHIPVDFLFLINFFLCCFFHMKSFLFSGICIPISAAEYIFGQFSKLFLHYSI